MATDNIATDPANPMRRASDAVEARTSETSRKWLEFAFRGYSAVAARKHGFVIPAYAMDPKILSDEELDRLVSLVRDLAHLPPG